jgi:hypothetical protein
MRARLKHQRARGSTSGKLSRDGLTQTTRHQRGGGGGRVWWCFNAAVALQRSGGRRVRHGQIEEGKGARVELTGNEKKAASETENPVRGTMVR